MADSSQNKLHRFSPARYGFASIISACVGIFCGAFLLPFAGWGIWFLVLGLSAAGAVICGLLGLGSGFYYNDRVGIVTGATGLAIVGFGVWFVWGALTNW